jgi:hypothetical protein
MQFETERRMVNQDKACKANSDPAPAADARLAGGNGQMAAVRGEGIATVAAEFT